jgi:hypothetical protein
MDECPHCGEPIEEEAIRCPHCGSDMETGWNPEVDYCSLELPEDDREREEVRPSDSRRLRWSVVAAAVLIALSVVGFLWTVVGLGGRPALYALLAIVLIALGAWASSRGPPPRP